MKHPHPATSLVRLQTQAETVLNEQHFIDWLDGIGSIGLDATGGISRLAFSPADLEIRHQVSNWMKQELGLEVRTDAWSNIFGRRPGIRSQAGVLMVGSHLDTVRNGGRIDGAAGVFCGLEMIRLLNQLDIATDHPLEVAVFSAEEANQSGISTIGSRGLTGRLQKAQLAPYTDDQGVPLLEAIRQAGGNPDAMDGTVLKGGEIGAFIEIHNEQMPRLEDSGDELGIVVGVTGIRRRRLTVLGEAGHGGTIPMDRRHDALAAAADLIAAVRVIALESRGEAVATIGHITVEPNSVNVVPGKAILELEIRSYNAQAIDRIDQGVRQAAAACREKHGVHIEIGAEVYDNAPRSFAPGVRKALLTAADQWGYRSRELVSMAGHDAYHLSYVTDVGMIFVPSRDGKSHCPEEYTDPGSLVKATRVLATTILQLDKED
jgi:beta-ureidopropionase / N-carbamoyl-L-amino-acid hydrolase